MTKKFREIGKGAKLEQQSGAITYDERNEGALYNDNNTDIRAQIEGADRIVLTDTQSQSVSNKSLDNSNDFTVKDTNFTVQDDADVTKQFKFNVTSVSSATTRVLDVPDENGIIATQAYVASQIATKDEASEISYDNTTSGLTATDVQAAIDEVEGRVDTAETSLSGHLDGGANKHDASEIDVEGSYTYVTGADLESALSSVDSQFTLNVSSISVNAALIAANTSSISTNATNLSNHIADTSTHGVTGNVVGTTDSQTLQNKTIDNTNSFTVKDTNFTVQDDADVTKQFKFNVTSVASASTRVLDVPNADGVILLDTAAQNASNKAIIDPTRLDVKKDTEANLTTYAATAANGQLCFATDSKTMYQVVDGALTAVGGGGAGTLDTFDTEDFESTSFTVNASGNNAAFLGGGTLDGTVSLNTSTPISGTQSLRYTGSTASSNDYVEIKVIDLDLKQRATDIKVRMSMDMSNFTNDVTFVCYDKTNSAELSDALDVFTASAARDFYEFSFYVPSTCAQISFGVHMPTVVNTETWDMDDVEWSTNPFVYKNLLDEVYVLGSGNGGTSITANVTDIDFTEVSDVGLGGANWNGTQFTVPENGIYSIEGGVYFTTGVATNLRIYKGGTLYKVIGGSATATSAHNFSYEGYFSAGEVLSLRSAAGGTLSNDTNFHHISISHLSETEHVVTPAKTTLTDWTSYTPSSTQGFGTVSSGEFYWRRVGTNMEISARFTAGTVAASEARISLPTSYTSAASGSGIDATLSICGEWDKNATGDADGKVFIEPSTGYVTFGFHSSTIAGLTKKNGSDFLATGNDFAFTASVPIAGWNSDATFLAAVPVQKVAYLKEVQTSGTDAGGFTSGSWVTRSLNTVEGDSSILSLSSSQFTLPAGKYLIEWDCPAFTVDRHITRLYDVTNTAEIKLGSNEICSSASGTQTRSLGTAHLTITSSTTYRIEHQCQTTKASNGLGVSINGIFTVSNEIYSQVKITKLR